MIGLGSQYLTAAGFGRYRITAASLGNLDLLGTLSWLKAATVQAILGAFGDDGKAVINATNAYLNGIAASDRDKATALAGFINDTPALAAYVCGWLEPDLDYPIKASENYLTGVVSKSNTTIKLISFFANWQNGWMQAFSAGGWQQANGLYFGADGQGFRYVHNSTLKRITPFGDSNKNKPYLVVATQSTMSLYGENGLIGSNSGSAWYGYNMQVDSSNYWKWECLQIMEGDTEVHRFLALPDGYVLDQINKNLITPSTP